MSPSPLHRSTGRRLHRLAALALAVTVVAACGSDDDDAAVAAPAAAAVATNAPVPAAVSAAADNAGAGEGTATATDPVSPATPPATTAAPIDLSGVKLRVGDQGQLLEQPLRLSGELDDVPYDIEFATFASGPLVNEAFGAGVIDIGTLGDTPALLSFAQGLETVVVGIRSSDGLAMTLVASPESGIETLADIAGKRVAWTTGSNQHGFVLRALDSVGLGQNDVDQVDVPLVDVVNVLSAGSADVAVAYEVFRPAYLAEHPGAAELAKVNDFTESYNYLLALRPVLDDPAKAAAVEDFVGRLVRATAWVEEHPDEWIQKYYVEIQKQTPEAGRVAYEAQGESRWVEIAGGDAQASQQKQADLFHAAGLLPDPVDVSPQYDPALTDRFTQAALDAG
ncbi:MAG TPA: ABC transporter substrate-binding protein [Ilumatobacter sp.]|nr:ABC transporter substrate-binding protein [Ilumatobacter sp.]